MSATPPTLRPEPPPLDSPRRLLESFLQRAEELANIGTFLIDLSTRTILISPEMAQLLRIGHEWTEMPIEDYRIRFYHPDDRVVTQSRAEAMYAGADIDTLESRVVRGDGEIIWVRASCSVEKNERGERIVVGVLQDITETANTIRRLTASEAQFRSLIDGAPVAIRISRDARTLWANPQYRTMLGLAPDAELVGRPITEHMAPDVAAMVDDRARRRSRGEAVPASYEVTFGRADGSTFPAQCAVSIVDLPDGPASVAFFSDVTELRQAEADLELQASVRTGLGDCLRDLPPEATVEQAGQAICEALYALPGVHFVAVFAFGPADETYIVGHKAPPGFPAQPSAPGLRMRQIRQAALAGSQAAYWQPSEEDGIWGQTLTKIGLKAVAIGPIIHGNHADGAIVLGTCDSAFARTLVERLPSVIDLSSTPSALLAERLHAHREAMETRAAILEIVARREFKLVFQPVVDLASRERVGFEALVRFASGQKPDRALADARRVGVGVDLEHAILKEAVDIGRHLPPGRTLHLNVSAAMLDDPDRLRELLERANRPIVLEVTEHEVVRDYKALQEALRAVGRRVRVAVDDAGAGVANFTHIVELRPDLVKLDIGLVRGVHTDVGRQALVIAMQHFARAAGCYLVAEGIESADEAATLRTLGVQFGQGYFFGRPDAISAWAKDGDVREDTPAGGLHHLTLVAR